MSRGLRLPLTVLALCCAGFVAYVLLTMHELPARVATHFNGHGLPNGWMTRSSHIRWMIGFGIGLPAFVVAIVFIVGFLGDAGINLPRREYWLAPERRQQTLDFLTIRAAWLASLLVIFNAGLHRLITLANLRSPVLLPNAQSWAWGGLMIAAIVIWMVSLFLHFHRCPDGSKA